MPVYADASESLARRVNGADLIKLRSQSRVLPAAVINEELEQRIEAYRECMGEAPSPREKRRMKTEARDELLPKAMLKSDKIWGYVDLKEKVLGIDAAQPTAAERFSRRLSVGVESINPIPLSFKKSVQDLLTRIFLGNAPAAGCHRQALAKQHSPVHQLQPGKRVMPLVSTSKTTKRSIQ